MACNVKERFRLMDCDQVEAMNFRERRNRKAQFGIPCTHAMRLRKAKFHIRGVRPNVQDCSHHISSKRTLEISGYSLPLKLACDAGKVSRHQLRQQSSMLRIFCCLVHSFCKFNMQSINIALGYYRLSGRIIDRESSDPVIQDLMNGVVLFHG